MIESDAIKLAISGGVMILTAIFVLRSGRTNRAAKTSTPKHLPQPIASKLRRNPLLDRAAAPASSPESPAFPSNGSLLRTVRYD